MPAHYPRRLRLVLRGALLWLLLMAFTAFVNWDAASTGNAANGGGFDATSGTPGTDYSQQDAAQIAYTDMVIGVTTTTFTSVLNPPDAALVGNIINVTAGTGFTVQRVQVLSVAAGVATCDKSLGTTGSTGGTGNMGGRFAAFSSAAALAIAGHKIWLKGNLTAQTATVTLTNSGDGTSGLIQVIGYGSTHGDGGTKPLMTTATNSTNLVTTGGKTRWRFSNLSMSNTAGTRGSGFAGSAGTAGGWLIDNCLLDGFTIGIDGDGISKFGIVANITNCEIKNCTTAGMTCGGNINGCYIHGNVDGARMTSGASAPGSISVNRSVFASNTGKGVMILATANVVSVVSLTNLSFYASGADDINVVAANGQHVSVFGCVSSGSTGYFIDLTAAAAGAVYEDYNCVKTPTTAILNNSGSIVSGGHSVTLTVDPYTNSGAQDFSLNNTAGGGAACRAVGWPATILGLATPVGYPDAGVYQHQDSGGGSGGVAHMAGAGGGFAG